MEDPKPRETYVHFKGEDRLYKIVAIARDCEDPLRKVVVYEQLYEGSEHPKGTVWTREISDFVGFKELDGEKVKRFKVVE